MALPSWASTPVLIRRAAIINDHGAKVADPDPAHAATHLIEGCDFQPAAGQELTDRREANGGGGTLLLPPDSDIRGTDEVVIDGVSYAVVGRPQVWRSPTRAMDHIAATLKFWEG